MSETEYFKGKLIPTGKTIDEFVDEFVGDVNKEDCQTNKTEYFEDEYDGKAFELDGKVYWIEKEEIDPYDDIFESKSNKDGSIDFEVKYYNGGCGLNEAIGYATKKTT